MFGQAATKMLEQTATKLLRVSAPSQLYYINGYYQQSGYYLE